MPPDAAPRAPVFSGTARYRVLRRLGAGAAGVVWSVVDHLGDRVVALKTLPVPDGEHVYWLKQEFRSLADLSHPNLVALHELEADGDCCFFTMEQIDGQPFDVALRPGPGGLGEAAVARVRALVRQLALGLDALHRHGRLHRDIKPSNVLVSDEGRVVLLDFGLVTSLESARRAEGGLVVGTLAYASPEQGLGRPLGPAADWYAVGVMLYEALGGARPFSGSFFENILDREAGRFVPLGERAPELPAGLAALVDDLLSPAPDDRPDARAVLARLGLPVGARPVGSTVFLGRADELGALERAAARARGGAGRAVLLRLHGPSGIGKTALASAFLAGLPPGLLALHGRCHPRETVPFLGLDGIVDGLSRRVLAAPAAVREGLSIADLAALAAVFPVFRAVYAGPRQDRAAVDRGAAFAALGRVLAAVAGDGLVVLWIDDLQWSDPDSTAALRHLLEDGPPRLLLLCSYPTEDRDSPAVHELVEHALAAPGVEVRALPLGPLGPAELAELSALLSSTGPAAVAATVLRLATEAGGSPGAVAALVRAAARPEGLEGIHSVGDALRALVDALPGGARRMLQTLAVAGRPLAPGVARAAALVGERARPAVLLESRGLLRRVRRGGGVALDVAHDGLREAVLAGISPEEQARLHAGLARVIRALAPMQRPAGGATPALDALADAPGGGRGGAALVLQAAEEADAAGAHELAARLYGRAVRLAPADPARWRWVAARAAALSVSGRGAAAAKAWLEAVGIRGAQDPAAPEVAAMRREAAAALLRAGRFAAGTTLLRAVLADVDLALPAGGAAAARRLWWLRARLRVRGLSPVAPPVHATDRVRRAEACWAAALGLAWVEPDRAAVFQARFVLEALALGDRPRVVRALASEAAVQPALAGDSDRAERCLAQAQALLADDDPPALQAAVALGAGALGMLRGELDAVLRWTARAEALFAAERTGAAWERTSAQVLGLWALAWRGDLGALRRRLPVLLQQARERGDLLTAATVSAGLPTLAWIADGRPELVLQHADQSMALWHHDQSFHIQHWTNLVARVHLDLAQDAPARAWARLSEAWPRLSASGLLRIAPLRGEAAWLQGRVALVGGGPAAAGLVGRAAATLDRLGGWWPALGAHLRAGEALAQGRTEAAQDALEAATRAAAARGLGLHAAVYELAAGRLVAGPAGVQRVARARLGLDRQGVLERAAVVRVVGTGLFREPAGG